MRSFNTMPRDITEHYVELWEEKSHGLNGISFALKDTYCIPRIKKLDDELIGAADELEGIINGTYKFYLLLGGAGIGKTALVSWLFHTVSAGYSNTAVKVWEFNPSIDIIRIVMGECERFRIEENKEHVVLVFENINGMLFDIDEVYGVIRQRQNTLYPNISVVITCRYNEIKGSKIGDLNTGTIMPFSIDQIHEFTTKYNSIQAQKRDSFQFINDLVNKFSVEIIGVPLILIFVLKYFENQSLSLSSEYDLFSLLISSVSSEKIELLRQAVALYMFNHNTELISCQTLYSIIDETFEDNNKYLPITNEKDIQKEILSDNGFGLFFHIENREVSFIHRSIYEKSLADGIVNIIKELVKNDRIREGELLKCFTTNRINRLVLRYVQSLFRNYTSLHDLTEAWYKLFVSFLEGNIDESVLEFPNNKQLRFKSLINERLNLFHNITSILQCLLTAGKDSRRLNQDVIDNFCYYLKLYSVQFGKIELDFYGLLFYHCLFENIDFSYIKMEECEFRQCRFVNCNMRGLRLSNVSFMENKLLRCDFSFAELEYSDCRRINCSGTSFRNASLKYSDFRESNFSNCDLRKADCREGNFRCSSFKYAICDNADFRNANLEGVNLGNASLNGIVFDGAIMNNIFI